MTAITSIYDAIAALSVSVDGNVIPVRNYNQLRKAVKSSDAPVRLLLAFAPESEGKDGQFIALGTLAKVTWQITDRLLWKPVVQGRGMLDVTADLVEYVNAYIEAIRANRALTTQSHIVGFTFAPSVFVYPDIEGTPYFGVDAMLDVEEIVSG